MAGRKKTGKSTPKNKETPHKEQENPLIETLWARIQAEQSAKIKEEINLNSAILESLVSKDKQSLKHLLQEYSSDQEAVKGVATNIVPSKVSLFFDQLVSLVQEEPEEAYFYPWLTELYSAHPHKLTKPQSQIILQKIEPSNNWQGLRRLQGKIALLQYQ